MAAVTATALFVTFSTFSSNTVRGRDGLGHHGSAPDAAPCNQASDASASAAANQPGEGGGLYILTATGCAQHASGSILI